VARHPEAGGEVRGRGLILGLALADARLAGEVARESFRRGLVVETAGAHDEVLKLLPALTIDDADLEEGLAIIADSVPVAMEKIGGRAEARLADAVSR
jgi:diaminobutyrate-2-oxoglutarate transaminase